MGPRPPPPTPNPSPPPPPPSPGGGGGFTENPKGWGGVFQERGGGGRGGGRARGVYGEFGEGGGAGGAEAPFTAKTSPFFGENALWFTDKWWVQKSEDGEECRQFCVV